MPPRLVLFVGAPQARSLDWDQSGLLETLCDPIARFLGHSISEESSTTSSHPGWRSLPLERQQLTTGCTLDFDQHRIFAGWGKDSQETSFFVASQVEASFDEFSQSLVAESFGSSIQSKEQILSHFYEESYARHENVLLSQIAPASDGGTSYTSDEFSFDTTSFDSPFQSAGQREDIPIAGHLTNLKDIPNAIYLASIQPQTMTVNLIVGIISKPEARAIRTRRGTDVELIEVLVGDETKSGFGINFWLSNSQSVMGDMRAILSGLRPQDVVLVRNVALSSFKSRVYGQSLRKEMTKIHLLYRNRVDRTDAGGFYNASDLAETGTPVHFQIEKTRKVKDWVMKFVGVASRAGKQASKGKAIVAPNETLPPDTQ